MKKIIILLLVASLASCGKSNEEQEAKVKALSESIQQTVKNVDQLIADKEFADKLGAINSRIK